MYGIHIINDSFAYNRTAEYICQADGDDDDDEEEEEEEEEKEEEEDDTNDNDHDNYNSVIIISIIKRPGHCFGNYLYLSEKKMQAV